MTDKVLTVRLPEEIHSRLDAMSKSTMRPAADLAEEAIAAFVESEAQVIEGIERDIADADAGRLVDHSEAMRRIRATIANPRAAKP